MAAVAVLGFAVTVLARGAIAGMGYEGDASRRLAASLIADRALFEIESPLALGDLPPVGRQESEIDGEYRLAVEVAPLDPAQLGIAALFAPEPTKREGDREASQRSLNIAPTAPPRPTGPLPVPTLLLLSVRVAWTEGMTEQAVTRTSFAYDATAAAQALTPPEAAAGKPGQPAGAKAGSKSQKTSRQATPTEPPEEEEEP